MFWCPLLICLLGVRFRDIYQLVPILCINFSFIPILYMKENWVIDMDCKFKSYLFSNKSVKDSIIEGNLNFTPIFGVLFMNFIGLIFSLLF